MPIGVQDFKEIREGDYLYIDKTHLIHKLITEGKYYFLSRPRRFGKSLLVSTLKYLFQGEKELFKGLYIYDKYDFPKHPVILISFSGEMRSPEELKRRIWRLLEANQKELGVECKETENYSNCFDELIRGTYEKYNQKVVILIDEYDKAILDNLDQMEVAKENRNILRGLYSIIKDMDPYIRFAFLTGVSKFSRAGIFSGLNNLKDISLYPAFGNMLGITQAELEEHFGELFRENGVELEKVKEWYNGYNFLGDLVYNPFDLLLFIDDGMGRGRFVFDTYWFTSGTPKFLIDVIDNGNFYIPELSGLKVDKIVLDSFDIDNIRPEVLLFQTGYLTIDKEIITEEEDIEYLLRLPNKEVSRALSKILIEYLAHRIDDQARKNIHRILRSGEVDGLRRELECLFASIPYHHHIRNEMAKNEGYYTSVVYAYLQSVADRVIGEDVTSKGRADVVVMIRDKVYIFEIKVDSSESPPKQIKERQYYKKYENQGKDIYLVGINIDSKEKNISAFEWERL